MNIEFHRPEFSLLFLVVGFLIYLTFRTHFFRKKYSQIIQASKTLEVSQTQKMPKNRRLISHQRGAKSSKFGQKVIIFFINEI